MPSHQLTLLCKHIENQNTDNFGKFYMYVSLLNTVTVRNKSFQEGLPKYSKGLAFWQDNELHIGEEISSEFAEQVSDYSRQFINPQPSTLNTLYNITMAYFRQGKISDLIYIIDKMLNKLSLIHSKQSHNKNIYDYIGFKNKKSAIEDFIKQISLYNQLIISICDLGGNSVLSAAIAVTGLTLILASAVTIIPSLIGLALMVGGAYGAYFFASQVEEQMKKVETQLVQIEEKMLRLPNNRSLFSHKNHNAFFNSIVIPLPYAALTALETLAFDEEDQKKLLDFRTAADQMTKSFL